jgi:hypothetical protein
MLQGRRRGGPWAALDATPVAGGGRYQASGIKVARGATLTLRWEYIGGPFRRWLPADSRTRTVVGR